MQPSSALFDHHTATFDWRDRLRAAAVHLALSALIALIAALLVFALWFPYPFREISGGRDLFLLVVCVDVVLGPLLTFAIFDRAKTRRGLMRDLAVVVFLQFVGLGYGLWVVNLARPVHLVFEYDRFRVVHHADIPPELMDRTPPEIEAIPWGQPTLLALRPFQDAQEKANMTLAALQGISLSARPDLWRTYEAGREDVLRAAAPLAQLKKRFPARAAELDAAVLAGGGDPAQVVWLPMIGRKSSAWTVLLERHSARVLGYVPLDSF